MGKRKSAGVIKPVSRSSDSDTAQADLFAAANSRLTADQPPAEPSSRGDSDGTSESEYESDSDADASEPSGSEADAVDSEDSAADSLQTGDVSEDNDSDDDDVDTAIIDYAAAANATEPEAVTAM